MEQRERLPAESPAQAATLYERDFAEWIADQVAALREARFDALDVPNLIDELEGLAGRDRRELIGRLRVILIHLLKLRYQPERASNSWRGTILTQQGDIEDLLAQSPSLRRFVPEYVDIAYKRAREKTALDTHLPVATFPLESPFTVEEILVGVP